MELFLNIYNYNNEVNIMIDQETLKKFNELYDKTYDNVLKYVICNCFDIEDVKDIIQNTYLELLKVLNKKITLQNANAYIMGIAKNKVKEFYRFHYKAKLISIFSKKEDLELLDIIPANFDLQKDLIKKEDLNFIWNYLKNKKVIIVKVFYLYYYLDMSIKEIAIKLKISEANVKHYLYRTLNELKNLLKKESDANV